jgi:hypothetical protein
VWLCIRRFIGTLTKFYMWYLLLQRAVLADIQRSTRQSDHSPVKQVEAAAAIPGDTNESILFGTTSRQNTELVCNTNIITNAMNAITNAATLITPVIAVMGIIHLPFRLE